jgi:hypothetical protein
MREPFHQAFLVHELDAAGALARVEERLVRSAFATADTTGVCSLGSTFAGDGVPPGGLRRIEGSIIHDVWLCRRGYTHRFCAVAWRFVCHDACRDITRIEN